MNFIGVSSCCCKDACAARSGNITRNALWANVIAAVINYHRNKGYLIEWRGLSIFHCLLRSYTIRIWGFRSSWRCEGDIGVQDLSQWIMLSCSIHCSPARMEPKNISMLQIEEQYTLLRFQERLLRSGVVPLMRPSFHLLAQLNCRRYAFHFD